MFAPEVIVAIKLHAQEDFPRECCGVVTADGYVRLENVHSDAENFFDCNAQLAPYLVAGTALALVHSHPRGPHRPSALDIRQQIAMAIPWGICVTNGEVAIEPYFFGDQVPPAPLLGRSFRFGPSGTDNCGDCGALMRDWYRIERGIRLLDFPRPDALNPEQVRVEGDTFYIDMLTKAGFRPADRRTPEIGDVVLIRTYHRAPPNHLLVYVGGGLVLHHMEGRLSCHDAMVRWHKFVVEWLRLEQP